MPAGSTIAVKSYLADGYADAMHRMCIGCHVKAAVQKHKPEMTRCGWCHKPDLDIAGAPGQTVDQRILGRSVVLPPPARQ